MFDQILREKKSHPVSFRFSWDFEELKKNNTKEFILSNINEKFSRNIAFQLIPLNYNEFTTKF